MLHHIKRLTIRLNQSAVFNSTASRGLFLQRKAGEENEFVVADGTVLPAGCVTRDVTADGPTLAAHVLPHIADNRLPFKQGQEVSVEEPEELEVEGTGFLTVNITTASANDLALTLTGGKLDTVASGQIPLFRLLKQLTPEVEGNVRILVVATALRAP